MLSQKVWARCLLWVVSSISILLRIVCNGTCIWEVWHTTTDCYVSTINFTIAHDRNNSAIKAAGTCKQTGLGSIAKHQLHQLLGCALSFYTSPMHPKIWAVLGTLCPCYMVLCAISWLAFRKRSAQLPLFANVGFARALRELSVMWSARLFYLIWWTMPHWKTNSGCRMIP